jgi:hypothetical protein
MPLKYSVIKKIENLFYKIGTNIVFLSGSLPPLPENQQYHFKEWFHFVQKNVGTKESIMDACEMIDYVYNLVIILERMSVDHFTVKYLNNIILHLTRYIQLVRGN